MKRACRRTFSATIIAALLLLAPALAGAAATSQADVELDWSNFQITYNPAELTVDFYYPTFSFRPRPCPGIRAWSTLPIWTNWTTTVRQCGATAMRPPPPCRRPRAAAR